MIDTAKIWVGLGTLAVTLTLISPLQARDAGNVLVLEAGDSVPLSIVPAGVFLRVPNDPGDAVWARVPEYGVELMPAPAVHPSIALRQGNSPGGAQSLYFSVISDRQRLYVKLRWADGSRDTLTRSNRFRDGAAVQFALTDAGSTSYMMGASENPVNIWYWRSDLNAAENLAAGGFGSTTRLAEQAVSANGEYGPAGESGGKQWTVVLSRPLEADGEHAASFQSRPTQAVAFAVWNGSEGQRDGHKRASTGWIHVDLTPLAGG